MGHYLLVAGVAAVSAYLATPLVRWAVVRAGALDVPEDRRVHREPTPTAGGIALYAGFVVALAVAWALPAFDDLFATSSELFAVLLATTALLVVGVVDDVRVLGAYTKLAGQLLAAGILVLGGVQIVYVWLPGIGVVSLSPDLSALLTVVWTLALINAVNFIDGLDGLAVGVSTIAAASFFVYAHQAEPILETPAELLTVLVVGAGIGFLPHNFNPARIFMGDSGSMPLGLLLASATVSGISRTAEPQFIDVAGLVVPVLLPLFVMAIPLLDLGMAVVRRVRGRRPVFHPDKQHIHHWLLEMAGGSHRHAVLVMYAWSGMLAVATLVLALGPGVVWRVVSIAIVVALGVSILVIPRILRRGAGIAVRSDPEQVAGGSPAGS